MAVPGDERGRVKKPPMLRVGFYHHSSSNPELSGQIMNKAVRAVREHMPYAEIWHLRGPTIPKFPAADHDIEFGPFKRPQHQALMGEGNILFLDIDCMVQTDVFDVFKVGFDVAVCIREQYDHKRPETWGNPHVNCGVIFSKNPKFWEGFTAYQEQRGWVWSDVVFCDYLKSSHWNIHYLPGAIYNHVPDEYNEDLSKCAIAHFKGGKKKWWMKHYEKV